MELRLVQYLNIPARSKILQDSFETLEHSCALTLQGYTRHQKTILERLKAMATWRRLEAL
jgi:hypothetical protein